MTDNIPEVKKEEEKKKWEKLNNFLEHPLYKLLGTPFIILLIGVCFSIYHSYQIKDAKRNELVSEIASRMDEIDNMFSRITTDLSHIPKNEFQRISDVFNGEAYHSRDFYEEGLVTLLQELENMRYNPEIEPIEKDLGEFQGFITKLQLDEPNVPLYFNDYGINDQDKYRTIISNFYKDKKTFESIEKY